MEKLRIRFVNSLGETLFHIEDGGKIEIGGGAETGHFTCWYIDDYHAKIGGHVYHIQEFAEMMERNIRTYKPVKEREETNEDRIN